MKMTVYLTVCVLAAAALHAQQIESGYLDVDAGRLFYETQGEGETIVLIHDGLIHREIWDAQFHFFGEKYRVVRYDRRGYGKSSLPTAPFSNIDDLNRLFIHLGIGKAVVFGMSAGGGLAIDFTLSCPEKVNALVLVGAVISGYGYTAHMFSRGGRINLAEMAADPEKIIQYFGNEDPYEISPDNIAAKERCLQLLQENPHNARLELHNMALPPGRPAAQHLSEILVPVLVLVGEFDIPDVHAHAGVIDHGIPNARREIVFRSGHLIPLEQPEAFNAAAMGFLNSLTFIRFLNTADVNGAVQYFYENRETDPGAVLFSEADMNAIGYGFLLQEKIEEAIQLFTINSVAYPDSWNVYDSLGEAFLKKGEKNRALDNYKKSLELNPGNANAGRIIAELTGKEQ